jgi:thymidylate synthase (FAD)
VKIVQPEVKLIAQSEIDWVALGEYCQGIGARDWVNARGNDWDAPDAEILVEAAGRSCYRSWAPGLNPNVTKVREDRGAYLRNILASGHGSVLEHASFTFSLHRVSRIVTHELVRHRAGTAISQESMRYVRLEDIDVWVPGWAQQDEELLARIRAEVVRGEEFQKWVAERYQLDAPDSLFVDKKKVTSFMRRFAPGGVATDMIWTANVRALRHIIELRTTPAAEEEIRLVFGKIAQLMIDACPLLFGDFTQQEDGSWVPEHRKV